MPMSHGVNKKAPPIVSPQPLPLTRFSQGLFVVLQAILHQHFFALIKLLQKIMHFQSKTNFFFQPIATTTAKMFEKNSSFHVKYRTTGKVQFLFLRSLLLVNTKFSFWEEDFKPAKFSFAFYVFIHSS